MKIYDSCLLSGMLPLRSVYAHCQSRIIYFISRRKPYASLDNDVFGSDNGLSPARRQSIIWTNAYVLSAGFFHSNFNLNIRISIQKKIFLDVSKI